jgi:phosphoribosyl 1,2-cyclic phosphodiesterase
VRIRIWGSRGSIASPGADTIRYGGNTACVELRLSDGDIVVLDAGTGIRPLGVALQREGVGRIHVLLSHLHVDHLEGLGMFAPIWSPGTDLHIWGPSSPIASLEERIATYFSPPLFPVHLSEVPAMITFHDAAESRWTVGGAHLTSSAILHPGPTVGYRIEEEGRVLAYLTDHEPALGADLATDPPEWTSGLALAYRSDVLIHDCQYTPDEYAVRVGFGHSTTEQTAVFAEMAQIGTLLLFHHDPMHSDAELESMRDDVIRLWGAPEERCLLAAEGATFQI